MKRIMVVYSGMGMKVGGMKTCGDYMFSGHTITMTTATLIAIECKLHTIVTSVCLMAITTFSTPSK
jgi:hypothetical protein